LRKKMAWMETRFRILRLDEVDSTNSYARRLAEGGASDGTVVVARKQTSGKGRLGRQWHSSGDFGLWFSVLLRPAFDPRFAGMLGISAGVAVAQAARSIAGADAVLKWPNDVLIEGRKVCGILAEGCTAGRRLEWAVVGIGINVTLPGGGFPPELEDVATALSQHCACGAEGSALDKDILLDAVLGEFGARYAMLHEGGTRLVRDEAAGLMECFLGRRVTIRGEFGVLQVRALDLLEDGALLVKPDGGEMMQITAADVSIGTCARERGEEDA
jgi:BirA family biotin operon repressor/biotin-[acetyl-CoA-carboxylase] ligase